MSGWSGGERQSALHIIPTGVLLGFQNWLSLSSKNPIAENSCFNKVINHTSEFADNELWATARQPEKSSCPSGRIRLHRDCQRRSFMLAEEAMRHCCICVIWFLVGSSGGIQATALTRQISARYHILGIIRHRMFPCIEIALPEFHLQSVLPQPSEITRSTINLQVAGARKGSGCLASGVGVLITK